MKKLELKKLTIVSLSKDQKNVVNGGGSMNCTHGNNNCGHNDTRLLGCTIKNDPKE